MSTPFDKNEMIDAVAMGEVEGWIKADNRKSALAVKRRWSEAEQTAEGRPGETASFGSSIIGRLSS